jgi:hypothetical protein
VRSIRMTLSLAFLAPEIVKAAVEGRLPRGFGLKHLVDLPMAWPDQWRALGRWRRRKERPPRHCQANRDPSLFDAQNPKAVTRLTR